MPKNPPCPECSAPYGDPHKKTCSRARPSRKAASPVPRPNTGAPRKETYGGKCPPHNPSKVKENKDGTVQYKCSRCRQFLGSW